MITLRCTKKLLGRLKMKPAAEPPRSTTRLGDWYGNLLYFGRRQLVLFTAEKSRLSVLVEAKDSAALAHRLCMGLGEVLAELEVPTALIDVELEQMRDVTVAATANRVVLGTMNDFAFQASCLLEEQGKPLHEASIDLCATPCVKMEGIFPCDVARSLFGLGPWESLVDRFKGKTVPAAVPRLRLVEDEG